MEIFGDWLKAMLTALLHSQVHKKHIYTYIGPEERVVGHYRRKRPREFIVYLATLAVSG